MVEFPFAKKPSAPFKVIWFIVRSMYLGGVVLTNCIGITAVTGFACLPTVLVAKTGV